jgi:hypothetical protein
VVMDADLIDPTRDRVWAVDVTISYTTYVVAETAEDAEAIAEEATDEDRKEDTGDEYLAREMTEPDPLYGDAIAWGHSLWDGQQVTVNEAWELLAANAPVRDTQTMLMPFVDEPPAEHNWLAAGRRP